LVGAVAAVGVAGGAVAVIRDHNTTIVKFSPDTSAFERMGNVKSVLARVLPSVVSIQAFGPACSGGSLTSGTEVDEGTGIVLSRSGEILTNNHVVANATEIKVTLYGERKPYPATLVGSDPSYDVALLQLHNPGTLKAVSLALSGRIQVGEEVLAIGNALALSQSTPSVTEGIISAEERSIKAGGLGCAGVESLKGLLQTQAAINAGNSGGPLVDSAGQVIGMNTAAATTSAGQAPTQNIGFAIPIGSIESLLPGLRKGGSIGPPTAFLGVEVVSVTAANRFDDGLTPTRGALVVGLFPGASAARAGIRVGDVIVRFEGRAITSDVSLTLAVRAAHPSERVTLEVYRHAALSTVSLVLGTKPAPEPGAS
jgi:putative serine protease PepD